MYLLFRRFRLTASVAGGFLATPSAGTLLASGSAFSSYAARLWRASTSARCRRNSRHAAIRVTGKNPSIAQSYGFGYLANLHLFFSAHRVTAAFFAIAAIEFLDH
jgi:hypothetical protein